MGEFVRTARNTYGNPGSVAQFDFHQSDKSKVSFPLLSFLSSNDLMDPVRVWYFMTPDEEKVNQLFKTPGEEKVNQLFKTNCNK